jgi:hypothetical protein
VAGRDSSLPKHRLLKQHYRSLPIGDYELLLRLPDEASSLASWPAYAVRFGNAATWEAETGNNRLLHTIHIQAPNNFIYLPWLSRS